VLDDPLTQRLLDRLLRATGPQTLPVLSRALGARPMALAARLEALRRAGCALDLHPQLGVTLTATSLSCWSDYIESHAADHALGRRLLVYRQTASTQAVARRLVRAAADPSVWHGLVVVADHQTAGRGRTGRHWRSAPGAHLLMTVVVARPTLSVDRLMLSSAVAVAEAVEPPLGRDVQIRWPNDVLVDGRKLAGILVERCGNAALIGIGVNVAAPPTGWPADLRGHAVALHELGATLDRLRVLADLLDRLDAALARTDAALTDAWRRRSDLLQQRVTVRSGDRPLTGRVIDLDPQHGLLLAVEGGPTLALPAATTRLEPLPPTTRPQPRQAV